MKWYEMKNADELREQLVKMLMDFDKDMNRYQTDIYLYIDEDGNRRLDDFTNVGGNSWLNDDHMTIYSDREHFETVYDAFDNLPDIAAALNLDARVLLRQIAEAEDEDPEAFCIDSSNFYMLSDFVNEHYSDEIRRAYDALIDDAASDYETAADAIIDRYDNEQEEN